MTTYSPFTFFLVTFLITWTTGFIGAYLSYQKGYQGLNIILLLIGMLGPFFAACFMMGSNSFLWHDFFQRLSFRLIQPHYLPIILLLPFAVVLLATGISVLFGHSAEQFRISKDILIVKQQLWISILVLFSAPFFEELGWRGYGVDSLRAHFSLVSTSLIFAFLWSIWHLPCFFVKDYYHHTLWQTNIIYVINFFVSIFPIAILLNWVYFQNSRSIMIAVLFHFFFNLSAVLFQTEQFTKCIVTVILLVISYFVI